MIVSLLLALLFGSYSACSSSVYSKTTEAFHRRNVFYAGGQYVFNETLGGTILVNQMYIEQLTPINRVTQRYPLVFLHGGGISGTVSHRILFLLVEGSIYLLRLCIAMAQQARWQKRLGVILS